MKKILTIDGGGIKGTQPAAFLAALEEDLEKPIAEYFDLISGTSTGGIIALGLAMGIPAKKILKLYEERGPYIFGQASNGNWLLDRTKGVHKFLKHIFKPKHDAEVLKTELLAVFGNRLIGEAKTRLLIPAWDADSKSVYIFKTAHHSRLSTDYKRPVLDAALATAAAPTYYKRHKSIDDVGLLDGGVWANNPVGIASIEAITLLGWKPDELKILSLGCVDEVYLLSENPGIGSLGRGIIDLFMDGQSRGALGTASLITDHPHSGKSIYRYSPSVPKGFFSLDDTTKISRLKGLGSSAARSAKPELSKVFFNNPIEPFVPVHKLNGKKQ
ncbi:CBASS cGAMP-activated phospholipase [Roseibium sp. MB-4]